ncbi:MAG TPA: PfkB family carbohydrate kinase [Ignavibacteriaceae bacterium]|nr:PfkB family carbohydrate kinase [Ignavibacteriaceae bacterium]
MILTITLNPLLERRFTFEKINPDPGNRNGKKELKAGGKGINVSRQLNNLETDNLAFTFLGGNNGKVLKDILNNEGIKFTSVRTENETRESAVIIEKSSDKISSYFEQNSSISENEVEEFKSKLDKMIQNCEIVVFSGSSPCKETNSIFPFGIKSANRYDKISICDTYGEHLIDCINCGPTILHNNIKETEESLNCDLSSQDKIIEHLKFLYSKNIKQSFITNGSKDSFCSNFDYYYRVKNPEIKTIDSTGSGDSFVAAIAYSLHNNYKFEESLLLASSLGLANSLRFDAANVSPEKSGDWKDKIVIEPVGKKMKILDVTPR